MQLHVGQSKITLHMQYHKNTPDGNKGWEGHVVSTPVQVISVSDRQYVILPPILPQALQTTQSHVPPLISNFSTQSSSTTSAPPTVLQTITNQD